MATLLFQRALALGAPAPHRRLVHDVVVVERREVDEFDHRRRGDDRRIGGVGAELRGQDREQRPESLAARLREVQCRLGQEVLTVGQLAGRAAASTLASPSRTLRRETRVAEFHTSNDGARYRVGRTGGPSRPLSAHDDVPILFCRLGLTVVNLAAPPPHHLVEATIVVPERMDTWWAKTPRQSRGNPGPAFPTVPMFSSSVPVPPVRRLRHGQPAPGTTCCWSTPRRSRETRPAATGSPRARSPNWTVSAWATGCAPTPSTAACASTGFGGRFELPWPDSSFPLDGQRRASHRAGRPDPPGRPRLRCPDGRRRQGRRRRA